MWIRHGVFGVRLGMSFGRVGVFGVRLGIRLERL